MLFLIAFAQPANAAERGWFQRTFGPADDDEDGIPDREDNCPTISEAPNGYADDDGCPDYLSFVTVKATHAGRSIPFAEYWMEHAGLSYVANGPAMSLENLIPGDKVKVAARAGCLGGEGTVYAGTDPVGIRLALYPERSSPVTVTVTDTDGSPLDASLVWTLSEPAACGPLEPRQAVAGTATQNLGVGTHTWAARSRGRKATGTLTITEPGPQRLDIVLDSPRMANNRRLSERVYFTSGRATLDTSANEIIGAVFAKLQETPDLSLVIEGHADTRASSSYNTTLAQRRADAVMQALLTRGIAATRLTTSTQGESEPAELGYDEQSHALNRRVEFLIRGSK